MKYITGIYALQFDLIPDMGCDWHSTTLDWSKTKWGETDNNIFGTYGIIKSYSSYLNKGCFVANPIRVALDEFINNSFGYLQGSLRKDFILNDKYNLEFFNKVIKLKDLPHWKEIDKFMEKEYMLGWLNYKESKNVQ